MFQRRLETLDRELLEKIQLERLRRTLRRIKEKNKKYWEKLSRVEPEDIKSLDDLKTTSLPNKRRA
jgi:phenylacetate-CoA ligase